MKDATPSSAGKSGPDPMGDRMKGYEAQTKLALPARTLAAIRVDGRAFHTWTKGLERPYSPAMIDAMAAATQALCEEVGGSFIAYTQSDEISLLFQDFDGENTQAWFGGQVQKVCSIAASTVTAAFARSFPDRAPALFDARVFALPDRVEAANYLVWRQRDCRRNAVSMLAEQHFSSKELHGVSTLRRREELAKAGVIVEDHDPRFLYGQVLYRKTVSEKVSFVDRRTGERRETPEPVSRRRWETIPAPEFAAAPGNWVFGQIPDPAA